MPTHPIANALLGLTIAAGPATAIAGGVDFTWDPSAAMPALGSAGAAFTADTILGTHYLYSYNYLSSQIPPTGPTIFWIEQINGFTQNGAPAATPGLNGTPGAPGSYGLYLTMEGRIEPGSPPGVYDYVNVALMADPGNEDGAPSSTMSGLSFANTGPTGAADDITLATGTVYSTSLLLPPSGGRLGTFLDTFDPAPGESGFFPTLAPTDPLYEVITTPASTVAMVTLPDGVDVTVLNGGSAVMDIQVPEPASLTLLTAGLTALLATRRRRPARPRRNARGGPGIPTHGPTYRDVSESFTSFQQAANEVGDARTSIAEPWTSCVPPAKPLPPGVEQTTRAFVLRRRGRRWSDARF